MAFNQYLSGNHRGIAQPDFSDCETSLRVFRRLADSKLQRMAVRFRKGGEAGPVGMKEILPLLLALVKYLRNKGEGVRLWV